MGLLVVSTLPLYIHYTIQKLIISVRDIDLAFLSRTLFTLDVQKNVEIIRILNGQDIEKALTLTDIIY